MTRQYALANKSPWPPGRGTVWFFRGDMSGLIRSGLEALEPTRLSARRPPAAGVIFPDTGFLFALISTKDEHPNRVLFFFFFSVYTLTSIYGVKYIQSVESAFEIIAEPNRRAILSLLVSSQQSVGEIERQLRMPQPTVSKHLRVLRDAGFVESTVDAQRRLYRLKPEPFQEVDAWLAPFRRFWSAHIDALERHLDRMDQSAHQSTPKKKGKEKTTRPNRERNKGEKK
jgi:DNA-binding transcriptional ArsR family regulator